MTKQPAAHQLRRRPPKKLFLKADHGTERHSDKSKKLCQSGAMKFIRTIMQDRSSAGAVAMLALLLFLLQGLANGVAHGNMATMALAADEIICSSHSPAGATEKQDPAGKTANNCCGTLCRLASVSAAALLVTPNELATALLPKVNITFVQPQADQPATPPNRESQPRGPPVSTQL